MKNALNVRIVLIILLSSMVANAKPFFQASKNNPYHLSVGAVLFNNEGLIACHHFKEVLGQKDIY